MAEKGYIKTIDKIEKEVRPREKEDDKDEIQLWYENSFNGEVIKTNKQEIVDEYVNVINHLHLNGKYSEKAFFEWSTSETVVDPWLIATAKTHDYTVVSFEGIINYYGGSAMSRAKIPNVCQDLNVNCTSLFSMMEPLGVKL